MNKVNFLGQECIYLKVITSKMVDSLNMFTYNTSNEQFGMKQANGKFKIVTADMLAKEHLEKGKGVCYKGFIYFQEDKLANNEHFQKLSNKYKHIMKGLDRRVSAEYQTYLNGAVYVSIKEIQNFPMVQSVISLYQTGVFSIEKLENKLQIYLKPEGVQIVLYEMHKSVEKVG